MGNVAVLGACVRLLLPDGLRFLEQADRVAHGRAGRREHRSPRGRATRGARGSTRSPATRRSSARPAPHGRRRGPRPLPGQHDRLARQPHRLVVARPAGAHGGVHRLRRVRALLPRGRDRAERRRDGRSTTSTARAAASARSSARSGTRSRWRRCRREPTLPRGRVGADRRRGRRLRGGARARPGDRLLPDHAADDHRRAARRARRGPRRRRVREPRERALDVRLRHRRVARRRPDVHGDLVAGAAVRARAAPPRLAGARAARRRQRQPRRSSRRGASSPTSRTA